MKNLINKHIEITTKFGQQVCGTIREVFPKYGTVMVYGDEGYAYRTCVAIEDIKGGEKK